VVAEERRLLGDRYELSDTLGRGGMAEVHEGRDLRLGRRVAVKILKPELARDPSFQARFRREAQSAASLNHPNIVAVYDTGEDTLEGGGEQLVVPYIVMEYVDGMTLRQLLQSGRRLLPERALEIAGGVLAALDYSHRHGIVHRDIKPANVMLTRTGDVKVMDFGIARALADSATTMTAAATVLGTAQYLSPEQARGEVVDARSDLYSAGCLLYELLTGRPPFTGDSPVSVAYQHVSESPEPPSSVDAAVDSNVDAVVLKALAKHPDDRYQSASEMRADIERCLTGGPSTVGVPTIGSDATVRMAAVAGAGAVRVGTATAEPPPKARSGWIWLGVVLLVLAVSAGTLFLGKALFGPGTTQTVTVPVLTNMTVAQATTALQQLGLSLGQTTPQVSTQPKDTIIDQLPKPGEPLQKGQAVSVTVSAGPQQSPVPQLVGLTSVADARASLTTAGLKLGTVTPQDSSQPENYVLVQSIQSGLPVNAGTVVNITVSTGLILVPDETNKSEAQAKSDLTNAGFQVNTGPPQISAGPAGIVLAQTPVGGKKAKLGSLVTLTISVAAPTPTPTPTPTSSGTPTASPTPSG
jgi:beta-lactam-binding protein with PASTA domain/predicted Ser/Thr protein kinase